MGEARPLQAPWHNQVMNLLRRLAIRPHALKLNGDGSPGHPLYLRGDARPFEVTG